MLCIDRNVNDIDLFAAAMLETHVPGGIVGPTFACIIALEFHNKKFGDAYYFENNNKRTRFSKGKIYFLVQEIYRKAK